LRLSIQKVTSNSTSTLKKGQTVRVTAGPFADFVGELEHLDDNGRVRVLLEIMGGKMRVALPQTLVAPS
jgi:Transcription antiterminator